MSRDLTPEAVARRLDELRAAWVPESERSVRRRMERPETGPANEPFEQQVAARLAELRALMELTAHLHGASSADE